MVITSKSNALSQTLVAILSQVQQPTLYPTEGRVVAFSFPAKMGLLAQTMLPQLNRSHLVRLQQFSGLEKILCQGVVTTPFGREGLNNLGSKALFKLLSLNKKS